MYRHQRAIALGFVVVIKSSGTLAAQAVQVESNASERLVAGCYAVATALPVREVSLCPGETPQAFVVPDTVELTLHLDHVGVVYSGPTWREQGWFLRVRPDPWIGFHNGASWRLAGPAQSLSVQWPLGAELRGEQRLGWSQTITAEWIGDEFVGTVVRRRGSETIDSNAARLQKVTCPPEYYFALGRWWRALRM
jgi:hypothetical protein